MILGWDGMRRGLVAAAVAVAALAAVPAGAQTPLVSCGADSLYLYSPASVGFKLNSSGRPGLTLSWKDLDRERATCFALTDTAGLGFRVTATGGFGDRVDRQLLFTATSGGAVAAAQAQSLIIGWTTEGASTYGRLAGFLNLANNGGFWNWDASASTWSQSNGALPVTWRQANCVALARGTGGVMYAGMTRGSAPQSDPVGLYRYSGGAWARIAADIFDASNLITEIAVSPNSNDRFAVGTATRGLYVTSDGGQTFTRWTTALDPTATATSFRVSAMEWNPARLVVAVSLMGVFVSTNEGASFAVSSFRVPNNRDAANPVPEIPVVEDLASDPANPSRLVAALRSHACYQSLDGGLTWTDLYGNLSVPDPEVGGAWVRNAVSVAIVNGSPATIVAGLQQDGLYRTTDGGVTWNKVALEPNVQPGATVNLQRFSICNVPGQPGSLAVFEDRHGMLLSDDGGAGWRFAASQPVLNRGYFLLPGTDAGDLVFGSWGGGLYQAGAPIPLRETYSSDTSPDLRNLDLGLTVTFGAGTVNNGDVFRVKAQTFQGWAVWRSLASDPDNMTLVGLYDRVNPEDCIVGYCGNESYEVVPRCFAAKRAACFDFSTPDSVRFFDDEIYNGFDYYYAVSSFDYGNAALSTPENNSSSLLFSPRWLGDVNSPFPGAGNRDFIQINAPAAAPAKDDEIYAYPNPVRSGAGFPGEEGRRVAFTNLPPGSRVRVFTAAGDDVNQLGPELQTGGQIYWYTDNHDGEEVAPGVYLYKVEMPERAAYWGRIVVIR